MDYGGDGFTGFGAGAPQAMQGGFLNSPPADALETGAVKSPGGKKRDYSRQSLTPVTIKQLFNAEQAHDESFRIDGHEISQVCTVGLIMSVTEQSSNIVVTLDDGTGRMEVRFWVASEDEAQLNEQKSQLRDGAYVRVIGHLKAYMNTRSVVGYKVLPITDYNEITHHFLSCISVHLYNTKGPLPKPGQPAATTTTTAAAPAFPAAIGGPAAAAPPAYTAPAAAPFVSGLNELHRQVLEAVNSSPSASHERGVHVDEIMQSLSSSGVAMPDQIKKAIEFLTDQGHIFNTIDDDHVRCTS